MLTYFIILSFTIFPLNYAAGLAEEATSVRTGNESQATDYPFLAYVNIGNNSCAGTILSDSWVITAGECGNTTSQESGWVYAGGRSGGSSIQKRRIASQHFSPNGHRLLLLQLAEPFAIDDSVSMMPIVRPGTFSGSEDSCKVITFGENSTETDLSSVRAVETRLVAGDDCASSAKPVFQSSPVDAASPAPAGNGTTAEATATETTTLIPPDANVNSTKNSGDATEEKRTDSQSLEVTSPSTANVDVVCSFGGVQKAASLHIPGNPVVCRGVLVALVTQKPSDGATRGKKADLETYYTAMGPNFSWIKERIPTVEAVPWIETSRGNTSELSKPSYGFSDQAPLFKYRMYISHAPRIRFPRLLSILMDALTGNESAKSYENKLTDELEPDFGLSKIFSLWFPLTQRMRGVIWLNRVHMVPQNEWAGDLPEKAEGTLRPLRRVKRSRSQQGSSDTARAQPWGNRRGRRGKRSRVPHAQAQRGTTGQRLAGRDKPPRAPQWRGR